LKKLVRKNKYKEFIKKILNVHPSSDCEPVLTEPDGSTESRSFPTSEFLVENLTNREFEILELLGKRLTNNEIARELFISQETVKSHLTNIYQKLQVKNRRQATQKARDLSILM